MGRTDPSSSPADAARRRLIKQSVVAGGVIWGTPVVSTFRVPAFAQVGSPEQPPEGCPPGTNLRVGYVKYDVDTGQFETLDDGNEASCFATPGACPAVSQYLADHFNDEATVVANGDKSVCITIPDDCTMITTAAAKEGQGCDLDADGGDGLRTVCFVKEGRGGGVSNVQLAVECCIPDDILAQCT